MTPEEKEIARALAKSFRGRDVGEALRRALDALDALESTRTKLSWAEERAAQAEHFRDETEAVRDTLARDSAAYSLAYQKIGDERDEALARVEALEGALRRAVFWAHGYGFHKKGLADYAQWLDDARAALQSKGHAPEAKKHDKETCPYEQAKEWMRKDDALAPDPDDCPKCDGAGTNWAGIPCPVCEAPASPTDGGGR